MRESVCPKCFVPYSPDEALASCTSADCPKSGEQMPLKAAALQNGQPVCPDCAGALSTRHCPRCGFELAGADENADMLGVSIVGAEGCGKSNYLTVLLNSMGQEMGKVYDCALYPLGGDSTIEQYNRQYYQPLFVEGKCVSSTAQEDVEPLIYSLVFSGQNRRTRGKSCNLTFYDACGANFDSVRAMEVSNRSIYNSKGILFLIDPSQFAPVRERRRARGKRVCEVDPNTLLSRTIHLIRSGSGQQNIQQKIDIPLAVCLTKLDLVRSMLDPSSFVRCPSRHLRQPAFDMVDYTSSSMEVESLMESWSGKEFINQIANQFTHYGFFAFSSLGAEPNDQNQIPRVSPHRVMDPLLWILWRNRIIPAAK